MKFFTNLTKVLAMCWFTFAAQGLIAIEPANPNTSPEAKALLEMYYQISGKYTLTGQHNYPATKDWNTRFAFHYIGQTPVIWSSDFGFSKDDYDAVKARPDIIKEAIKQHQKGAIITLCWHAVPPTADEPVTFQPRRDSPARADSLASIQGQLLDEQFKDVLTPGTRLYNRWTAQVDTIAFYLKKLQDAKVPVLWRPYHELNGDWFWWGGRIGEYSTARLYRQLYDRFVNVHKLNNLIWVWNVDRPSTPIRKFSNFYPGDKYLDIVSLDVYGSDFNHAYYDSLVALSNGKPLIFGEVGNPPSLEVLKSQPKWASWVIWAGMTRNTSKKQYEEFVQSPIILNMEKSDYHKVAWSFRKACNLPALPLKEKYSVSFSGNWIFSEAKSEVGNKGTGNIPSSLDIDQDGDDVVIKQLMVNEWGDDKIVREEIVLDGTPVKYEVHGSPKISKASWDANTNTIKINSTITYSWDGKSREVSNSEEWSLLNGGKTLNIKQTSKGQQGEDIKTSLVYVKQ